MYSSKTKAGISSVRLLIISSLFPPYFPFVGIMVVIEPPPPVVLLSVFAVELDDINPPLVLPPFVVDVVDVVVVPLTVIVVYPVVAVSLSPINV